MKAKCPKCDTEFEAKGYSYNTMGVWVVLVILGGAALGLLIALLIFIS